MAVRGDSIRDLYAKGLALVGLGLLAGAGALVDYWPTRDSLPAAPTLLRPDLTAHARPVPGDWLRVTEVRSTPPRTRRPLATAPIPSIRVSVPSLEFGEPVASLTPPAAEPMTALAVLASAAPATPIASGELLILPPLATPVRTATAWPAEGDDDSFFLTGAVKRTGASILRTSARTGASIVDAVRTLGGAFRRALPN
jgi:hypothetical protein